MYYISQNKIDLENYNSFVSNQVGLNNPFGWASILEHQNGIDFAILKHEIHTDNTLTETPNLEGWFNNEI